MNFFIKYIVDFKLFPSSSNESTFFTHFTLNYHNIGSYLMKISFMEILKFSVF
jgi:hypothetical protein